MRITEFFAYMLIKLQENGHKSGWHDATNAHLLKRVRQETKELELAIKNGATADEISREAADIANFCFMIADNAQTRSEHP